MKRPPKHLYKFFRFNKYAISAFIRGEFWFSRPADLNDPFDCSVRLPPRPSVESIIDALGKAGYADPIQHWQVETELEEAMEDLRNLQQQLQKTVGVFCLTEHYLHPLMWAHYAESHRGFCVRFDVSMDKPVVFKPVSYTAQQRRTLDLYTPWRQKVGWEEFVDAIIFTKPIDWSYEKEWRAFHVFHENSGHRYRDIGCPITGLYFGMNMPDDEQETLLRLISKDAMATTEMFRMRVNPQMSGLLAVPR